MDAFVQCDEWLASEPRMLVTEQKSDTGGEGNVFKASGMPGLGVSKSVRLFVDRAGWLLLPSAESPPALI